MSDVIQKTGLIEINGFHIEFIAGDPVSPLQGRFYYNTSTSQLRFYNGSSLINLGEVINHGDLLNLLNDDHTQYALLAGRSGGQTLIGGTASGNSLTLSSTSDATKGQIIAEDDLQAGGEVLFQGRLVFDNEIVPTALASNTNNWNPSGLADANVIRASSSSDVNLTGITAPSDDVSQVLLLANVGSNNITLIDQDSNSAIFSSAANRFALGRDIILRSEESCKLWYDQSDNKWRAVATQTVFGSEYQTAESNGLSTTTVALPNYATKLSYTTTDVPAGTYRIGFTYVWGLDAANDDFVGRVTLDGTPIFDHRQEPKDSSIEQEHCVTSWHHADLTAGTHTIAIQYAADDNDTARIQRARIEFWRVS